MMADHIDEMPYGRCPVCGGPLVFERQVSRRIAEYACQGDCRMITEVEERR